ncbi:AAA family ATPase [Nocardia cyriacigeorgica]|uniref:AAA family ATPase n=1 Tax=Nocardia cyriacigeorgica TaxID=135487 RepID=UPI0011B0D46C|nr:MoxR family ATPase [Nocardia cyriacigeorgica]
MDGRAPVPEAAIIGQAIDEIGRVIVGKQRAVQSIMAAVLAGGHVLIEDLPGLGKTTIARTFATVLGLETTRVQFTPDLLPADLIGATVYNAAAGRFDFRPGPIFTNVLIADEINRTPPKTQSALLEAMAEGQVSTDGVTRPLPSPFLVIATQNPIEHEGTYPLPEAQLDRFAMCIGLGYSTAAQEKALLRQRMGAAGGVRARQIVDAATVDQLRAATSRVDVDEDILDYIVALVRATRTHVQVEVGASPRAELDLLQVARAQALLRGRDFVVPEDVKAVAPEVVSHRVSPRPEAWMRRIRGQTIVAEVLARTPVPRLRAARELTGPAARPVGLAEAVDSR